MVIQGNLTANSVIFSLNSSNPDAFIQLSGNGSVFMVEIIIKVYNFFLNY
jgi:hypothetical protein